MIGKHTKEAQRIKELENELRETIRRSNKEIKDIKRECAEQFKRIYDLLTQNSLGNGRAMSKKATEIAKDNYVILTVDNYIENDTKILELPKHDQVTR